MATHPDYPGASSRMHRGKDVWRYRGKGRAAKEVTLPGQPGDECFEVAYQRATRVETAEVVEIPTSNNERIRGWYAPPQVGKPLIVYYKGNADSFSDEHVRYEQFVEEGFGFLAFDYRGFPASPGVLSQENVLKDAIAAFAFAENKGFPLVIWGRSLGSGPATYVASERNAEALLLETPFDSAVSVAKDRQHQCDISR